MRTATGLMDEPAADPAMVLGPWQRRLPLLAAVLGVVIFGALAVLGWAIAAQNEQRLLQQQTDQAGAVLSTSISQVRAPLDGAARAAAATDGDPATFTAIVTPLLGDDTGFSSFALYDVDSPEPLAAVGDPLELSAPAGDRTVQLLTDARSAPFVVIDLLDRERTLGFAAGDVPDSPRFVVYAERTLSPDPNVRRRSDEPFSQIEYTLYLGDREDQAHLLGASVRDLPMDGRQATTIIPYGNREILFVTTPIGRLGGRLMTDLWWIVLVAGAVGTTVTVMLLRQLNRSREQAIELASRNARKHREQHDIAETLQLGLLPERLTPPPGAGLASRYWPAESASLIGGDFYDAFRIDDRRWGIVIGDMCGKGMEAAALTGLVRHTIRTAIRYSTSPAAVLHEVHTALSEHEPPTFCTVCFMTYRPNDDDDPADGGRLVVALGGHPPPLLARDGTVSEIGRPGTILGMVDPTITDVTVDVHAGDTIVLFTDGLTDAPADEAVPMDELEALMTAYDETGVEQLVEAIRASTVRRRPEGASDDTALVVIRFGDAGRRDEDGVTEPVATATSASGR